MGLLNCFPGNGESLDTVLAEQNALIDELKSALENKKAGQVNGILQECTIKSGETISAGDFVELVHAGFGLNASVSDVLATTASMSTYCEACALSDNEVFVCYGSGYCSVITIGDEEISISTPTQIDTLSAAGVVKLSDNKVLVATSYRSEDAYSRFTVVAINEDKSLTVGESLQDTRGGCGNLCALDETNAVFAYIDYYESSSGLSCYYVGVRALLISDMSVTLGNYDQRFVSNKKIFSYACRAGDGKVAVVYAYHDDGDTTGYRNITTYHLNEGVLTEIATLEVVSGVVSSYGITCGEIKDDYVFVAFSSDSSTIEAKVYNCTNTEIIEVATSGSVSPISGKALNASYVNKCARLTDGSHLIYNSRYDYAERFIGTVESVTYEGSTQMTISNQSGNTAFTQSGNTFAVVGNNLLFLLYNDNTSMTALYYPQVLTTEVRSVKNKISGVALGSGVGGDTIKVVAHEMEVI